MIILVLDINEPLPAILSKNNTCLETIGRIGAAGVPIITVLNKIDRLTPEEANQKLEALKEHTKNTVLISALKRTNLDVLRKEILRKLEGYIQASFTVPIKSESMTLVSWVYSKADVKKANYQADTVEVDFEADPEFAEKVKSKVVELNGKFKTNKPQQ